MEFGTKIRQIREAKNKTQQELAEALDIAQSAYNLLERNKRKIEAKELLIIAEFLQTPIEDFFKQESKGVIYNHQHDNESPINYQHIYNEKFDNERIIYEKLIAEKDVMLADKNAEISYLRGLVSGFVDKK